MTQKELASVKCPVLIIQVRAFRTCPGAPLILAQAENSPAHPLNFAEQIARELVGVPGGVRVFKVKGRVALT